MSTKKYHGKVRATSDATSLFMLRIFVRKLQTSLSFLAAAKGDRRVHDDDDVSKMVVPEDVKQGHFAVVASKGSERKRFIAKLEWLNSPEFVRLLELAEEEYGFEQSGALVVPCTPQELERIFRAGLP